MQSTRTEMYCSLSGAIPQSPVVCVKTGHLYEKRIIEKAIESNGGKCPHTDVPISQHDLLSIQPSASTVKPAAPSSTDIPSLLKHMQNEWDAKDIQLHELRQALHRTRQELATALYRLDASHRVIAKLRDAGSVKEVQPSDLSGTGERVKQANASTPPDEAADENGSGQVSIKEEASKAMGSNLVGLKEAAPVQWPDELLTEVKQLGMRLVTARKSRRVDEHWANSDAIASFSTTHGTKVSTAGSAVTSIAMGGDKYAFIGLGDGQLKRLNVISMEADEGCSAHEGEKGGINCVWWDSEFGSKVMSGGGDGWVRIWDADGWKEVDSIQEDEGIIDVQRHAKHSLCLIGHRHGYTWHDLERRQAVTRVTQQAEVASAAIHPDGLMFATGRMDGVIQMWDAGSMQSVQELGDKGGHVSSLSMSEKGYYLSCSRNGVVELWDLRKRAIVGTVHVGGSGAQRVVMDGMGEFGCAVGWDAMCLFAGKKKAKTLGRIPLDVAAGETGKMRRLGAAWGEQAKCVYVGSGGGEVFKVA